MHKTGEMHVLEEVPGHSFVSAIIYFGHGR
jgi:hypothetical protein